LALLALLIAGCGGGSRTSSGGSGAGKSSDSETAGAFTARASAICSEAKKAGQALKAPKAKAELAPFFDRALRLAKAEVAGLKTLRPPSEHAAAYRTWLAGLDRAVGLLGRADVAAKAGSVYEVQAAIRAGDGLAQRNTAHARAAGLAACGEEG
jgi:soluble cytochrome b562